MNPILRIARINYRIVQKSILCSQSSQNEFHAIRKMSQKSITSFFTKTPIKTSENKLKEEKKNDTSIVEEKIKSAKRQRLDSSENEISPPPTSKPNRQKTPNSETKKTPKTKTPKSNKKAESKKEVKSKKTEVEISKKENKSPATKTEVKKSPVVKNEPKISNLNGKGAKHNGVSAVVEKEKNTEVVAKLETVENESEEDETEIKTELEIKSETEGSDAESPIKLKMNGSKRNRLASSSSEEEILKQKESKPAKKVKKMRKTSSASETEDLERSSEKYDKKAEKIKVEKSSPVRKTASGVMNFFTTTKEKKETKEAGTSESDYNPTKSKYHPIKDACWSRGDKVPYLALAKTLEAIEATSARLKIVEILSNFLRSVMVLTPEDLVPSVYMCLNKLAPAYESLELGVADTYLQKAIAQSTGRTLAQVRAASSKAGDLGLVAEQCRASQRMMFQPAPLSVRGVFAALREVAKMTGQASMSKKVSKIQTMFVACRHSEARYFIRSLAGKLRVGLAEQSVLQAIAQACTATPPLQEDWPPAVLDASKGLSPEQFKANIEEQALIIKTTYCECPNYDKIIPVILQHGVAELPKHCRLTPGIPLKPMLAHPTKGISEVFQRFENLKFTCEWKYDGERAQIHVPSTADGQADIANSAIFSRNQENNTSKYPDVLGRLTATLKPSVSSCVLDCEAVAWDQEKKQILPFQILSTRKRKDATVEDIKVQVCLFMFDLLYLNGEALVTRPLAERRQLLREHFNVVEGEWLLATSKDCSTLDEVQEFLEESVRGSCEGLMVKTLAGKDATYEIAKRSRNWLKLKKDYLDGVGDTLDIVVIGGYHGRGKRTGHYGGFLLACYDPDAEEYQSICKIGTGFSEDDLAKHSGILNQHKIDGPRNYYRYDDSHLPDVWFAPACVWEVLAADLSLSPVHRAAMGLVNPDKGISLRFPRFIREREDKTPEEATSARQVADIYLNQDVVKNQSNTGGKNFEDDFY